MQRRRRRCNNPKDDAKSYIDTGGDKAGLDVQYIDAIKGRGIFTSIPFQTGDFLTEYRGELINEQECETRLKSYPFRLKGFLFEFHFDGKLWCVDAAKEHESLGRLVNDDHRNPTAKMKKLSVQGKPHLCLFADRDISPGEEITYNYGDSDWPWRCKGLDEVMPLETCEATQATSPNENIEETVTDSACTETTESHTKTTGPVLSPLSRAAKHCLRIATESSLDRCASCVGPVSSKWLGYECRECSQVWHKSCFRNIQDDNLHYLPEPSENSLRDELQSNKSGTEKDQISDECMSGEEYIPDSQGEDDGDSDASIPLVPSQSKAGQITFQTPTDVGKNDPSDTSLPVLPSTSEDWPPLDMAIDATTSGPSISNEDSYKKKPKAKADLLNHLTLSTKNYCFVCRKPQSKIGRHLTTHKTHAEIKQAFSLPKHSKERKILIEKMRNKGNFQHNTEVLQSGTGKLKVKRKPNAQAPARKYIHCMHCKGLYIRKDLWRHVRRCPCKPENEEEEKKTGITKVLGLASAQESVFSQQISSGVWKLLNGMRQDEVASAIRNDLSIIQFAQSLYNTHGLDPTKYEYIRQKLREAGRLLLCLRTEFSVYNLEEAVKPANCQRVVQAVKKVSGFDKRHTYAAPSLAVKLGYTLLKINDIIHCRALLAEDDELIKSTKMFEKLYTAESSQFVSRSALNTQSSAKHNKPSTLPFTEDVQLLHRHLDKSAESAMCNLKEQATPQNYAELAKVALAQIIVFNRRRTGEVSKMRLKHFNERDNAELHPDVAKGLSTTEQRLCNYFSQVEITGRRGRKVAVLLSPSMLDALSLLVSKRTECGVCSTNVFLFARPKCMSCYRGQDSLRHHANKCGAKHPEHLRSIRLRKHVATLSQVLNLKTNELDQVADFLGHDIRVHQDFYRLPVPTTQLAKISRLLLSMEKGQLSSFQGKSLDEIDIEDEMSFSDAEDVNGDSDDDETAAPAECGTSQPVTAASTAVITEQDIDPLEAVSSTVSETAPPYEDQSPGKGHATSPQKKKQATGTDMEAEKDGDSGKDRKKSRKLIKKVWAKDEVAAVMRHFKLYIAQGQLATKSEIHDCKQAEGKVLGQRTLQNIRDFVRNRGIARKKKSE